MGFSYCKRLTSVIMITAVVASVLSVNVLAAPVYNDVPSSHWAYSYISAVADRGLMLGDTTANFRPDDLIDKFDTSKILARGAGYKYENISSSEQEYYNACYEKNKSFLSQYGAKFSKWNTSADREISYLLEKEIISASDLNQFVILDDSGREQLRALSRGEAAVFITKLIGKNNDALSGNYSYTFKDDAKISATVKPYVYYLRSTGVISGDTDGNFNPNGAVTRASMAVMLARALGLTVSSQTSTTGTNSTASSIITTVAGTIDMYYANLNALQIVAASGDKKIYRLANNATVYIDGVLSAGGSLKQGMIMSGVVSNDELLNIQAQNTVAQTPAPSVSAPTQTSAPTDENIQYMTIDGTVGTVEQTGSVRTLGINIQTVNPRDGSIITTTSTYTLSSDCKITRGGSAIQFSDVIRGDIVTAKVYSSNVYELQFEERVVILKDASLEEKRYNQLTGQATLVVKGNDKTYELRVAADTTITRKTVGTTTWDQLRVGDLVDLTAEYGILKDIVAYGVRSTADGWVDSISISSYGSYINLRDSYGTITKYYVITDSTDIYSLRVGNKIRVRLDSMEISTVLLLEEASTNIVTGYVTSIRSGAIALNNTTPYGVNGKREIAIDSSTVIINSRTGEQVSYTSIKEGQRVYVVFGSTLSDVAITVTVLAD